MVPTGSQRRKSRFADSGMKGFVTKKGSLRIPSIGYQDAGIYTCMGNKLEFLFIEFFFVKLKPQFFTGSVPKSGTIHKLEAKKNREIDLFLYFRNKSNSQFFLPPICKCKYSARFCTVVEKI